MFCLSLTNNRWSSWRKEIKTYYWFSISCSNSDWSLSIDTSLLFLETWQKFSIATTRSYIVKKIKNYVDLLKIHKNLYTYRQIIYLWAITVLIKKTFIFYSNTQRFYQLRFLVMSYVLFNRLREAELTNIPHFGSGAGFGVCTLLKQNMCILEHEITV